MVYFNKLTTPEQTVPPIPDYTVPPVPRYSVPSVPLESVPPFRRGLQTSIRELHRQTGIHRVTLKNYLHRFKSSGKCFGELAELSDHELSVMVHPQRNTKAPDERFKDLNGRLEEFARQLSSKRNKYLTKQVLWEEYLQENPNGYQ